MFIKKIAARILSFIYRAFILIICYLLLCYMTIVALIILDIFFDTAMQNMAWMAYNYLHSHYGWYEEIYGWGVNPVLGDFMLFCVIVFPVPVMFVAFRLLKSCKCNWFRRLWEIL
ncbi:hypothetical protein CHU32_08350 [Superficieibacter electus]|uniref:Uncharacterized protein n=1 Tax=Superficieibacter electus TaxID=2022662 RepID=A0A2P5GRE4_9ENTR|nr:hypothetical protein CHU33_06805 [Superficieibacter electus]POP49117.1 hypothetical protein CHU32_08350 [Superficieibacter electus]